MTQQKRVCGSATDYFIVVCRADRKVDGLKGDYELATKQTWLNAGEAQTYADGISSSREPIVVSGRFGFLWTRDKDPE